MTCGKILVVDDEEEIVALTAEFLAREGYEVRGLSDPRQALKEIQTFSPDLCILDVRMPFISGPLLWDQIMELDANVQAIFLSSHDEAELAANLIRDGAFDYLLKPTDFEKLRISVSWAFEHRQLLAKKKT